MSQIKVLASLCAVAMLTACAHSAIPTKLDSSAARKTLSVLQSAVTMKLSDGETVTIQPGAEPPWITPDEIPSAILTAVQKHQNLSIGNLHAVNEIDDTTWEKNAPMPAGGRLVPSSTAASFSRRTMSATGSSPDHATDGWYIDGFDSNPNFNGEGYVEFAADMGLPTLYPPQAGASGAYIYYAPTSQGSSGNPLEVGLRTVPNYPYAGTQSVFIYDWASPTGGVCNPNCVGFTSYSPSINSTFTSKYVQVLSHGVPEWSIETFQSSNGWWYFGIYNHSSGQWEFPYAEQHTQVVYNSQLKRTGPSGGHGYFEYYLPAHTGCAGADPAYPSTADTVETDAQQYSATSKTWTRISNDAFATHGITGTGVCFFGPNTPYFSENYFADGWSDWEAYWE